MRGALRRGALALALAQVLTLSGCELILRFDRDRIDDGGVVLDGEVVSESE